LTPGIKGIAVPGSFGVIIFISGYSMGYVILKFLTVDRPSRYIPIKFALAILS
jgi:hypothetical protein